MEARHERRARELEQVAAATRQQQEVQRLRDARAHAAQLAAKDAQITRFRTELDALLRPLQAVVASQQNGAALETVQVVSPPR